MNINYIYLIVVVVAIIHLKYVQPRKNCKLLLNAVTKTYYLSCDKSIADSERSITRREKKRDKKDRKSRRGSPGPMGPIGPKGNKGDEGMEGADGPMGPTGPTGVPGPRGHTGKKGDRGTTGFTGPTGPQGITGIPGNCIKDSPLNKKNAGKLYHCLAGPQGPQGNHGSPGLKGSNGEPGNNGLKGEQGEGGSRGRRGPIGLPGIPGSAGAVKCETHSTEWFSRYATIDGSGFQGLFCPSNSFLQGFKIERVDLSERYQYVCCKIG